MLNTNNYAAIIRKEVLVELTKLQLSGVLLDEKTRNVINELPEKLVTDDAEPFMISIENDRKIICNRILASLGHSVEDYDGSKPLSEYVAEAYAREKPTWPMLTMIQPACNACVKPHYFPTDACQACLARPCQVNCPKQAIEVTDRCRIDPEKCINCGLCSQNCPYHAIIKTVVPCEEACPVGAISKGTDGKESIDFEKCIFCGKCMSNCPFSAMMGKSELFDVVKHIMAGDRVVAMYAPAIGAQFKGTKPGQLEASLEQAGFNRVWEVAIGADITADKEAAEFEERMKRGDKMMTTSCCPAYVRAVNIHVPELSPCISETKSPMVYTAELAKSTDPDCITVFIGPCLAKRREAFDTDIVDYVLSIDEVNALFEAKEIDVTKAPVDMAKIAKYVPTVSGRNFAKTGGVAESVRIRLKDKSILRPAVINGLDKNGMKQLSAYGQMNAGTIPVNSDTPNLIEVMACEGGCIAGPSVITNPKLGAGLLTMYANAGSKTDENGMPAKCSVTDIINEEK